MRVLITGGASGIGRATAELLVERFGAEAGLLLADRNAPLLEEVAADLRRRGATVATAVADLAHADSAQSIVERARAELGGLDGLVSNAGLVKPGGLKDLSVEDYDTVFAINTRATWLLAKHAYPMLREARGAIVAIASIASESPAVQLGTYSASKAALVMLVRQMCAEWGPDGIRANVVSPGAVATPMTNYGDPERRKRRAAGTALGIVGEARDIAEPVVFLLSPQSRYVSGINLLADGGGSSLLSSYVNGRISDPS